MIVTIQKVLSELLFSPDKVKVKNSIYGFFFLNYLIVY